MSKYDQSTPGADIIDLRDVVAERDRILDAICDASNERDAERIESNQNNPHGVHAEGCGCTAAEWIEDGEFESALSVFEDDEELHDLAGVDLDEVAYIRQAVELEAELWTDLDSATLNEPVMIAEGYFTEYAEQLADDIGAIDHTAGWPLNHIDWEAAASQLKQDYSEVEFGGTTYLWRNY